jgi:hypothetical protein
MVLTFWLCIAFVVYTYVGYPMLLWMIGSVFGRPVCRATITPQVSFIITARNEAQRIAEKLENTLRLDYPRGSIEIIVASDCSDDGTDDIVRQYATRGVMLVRAGRRGGKEHAQRLAIEASSGAVVAFSDVATRLTANGVRQIVQGFADPDVGCVSSVDQVLDARGEPTGEGAYVRYEMLLREMESRLGSVVGLSGSFFAARRTVCTPWSDDLPSDFNTLLNTLRMKMRGVADPEVIGSYPSLAEPGAEYRRKVRTVTRGLRSLGRNAAVLNPLRFGLAAWQLLSHKMCRWLVPFALIGLFSSNLFLIGHSRFYDVAALVQLFSYGFAALGFVRKGTTPGLLRLLTFFALVNVSILHAWFEVLRGNRAVTWEPSRR